jgi:NAD(P)H-hydrate repair Nnr-like enzyme with NAD(P)H-hydrate epimerase domain/8-oxo-dGTP pyrophosphatase MutT (NUDIX family)
MPPEASFWERLTAALAEVDEAARIPPPGARTGAVLVLLEDGEDGPRLVLTRRRPDLRSHPGQLSFPGGRIEAGEDASAAAVREATEEVGLDPASIELVGVGPTFYVPPSRFWVVPVVARWRAPHPLRPSPREVAEVLHVDLATLRDERRWRFTSIAASSGSAWAWRLDDDLLWGATALVVRILLDVTTPGWDGGRRAGQLDPALAETPWLDAPRAPRRSRLGTVLPERDQGDVPHVSVAQVRAMRAAADASAPSASARIRRAGEALALAAQRLLAELQRSGTVTVLAGPSANGAVGLAAAQVLAGAGLTVTAVTVGAPREPAQLDAARALGVEVVTVDEHPLDDRSAPGALVLDAILGVGARPPLHGGPDAVARWLRRHDVPVISAELPSGLSADRGLEGACLTADVTVALGLPTLACREPVTQAFLGDLYVADLGLDAAAWRAVGVRDVPEDLFVEGPLVRLTGDARGADAGTPLQTEV